MSANAQPSLDELRAVVQPPEVLARRAEHWTGDLYMRRFSIHLTRALIRTPISANGVTGLMILSGSLAGLALLVPGIWGPLLAVALTQLQMLIDCCDGEVARWRGTYTPAGIFLDKVGHYLAEGLLGLGLGLRASGITMGETASTKVWQCLFAGAILMAWIWFNKALNDMVHVARAFNGLDKLAERKSLPSQEAPSAPAEPEAAETRSVLAVRLLGTARTMARFVPFHKAFHSIELSLVVFAVALIGLIVGQPLAVMRVLLVVLAVAIVLVSLGHAISIIMSSKLRARG